MVWVGLLGMLLFAFYIRVGRAQWCLLGILAHRDRRFWSIVTGRSDSS